jgi:hypothetical protein
MTRYAALFLLLLVPARANAQFTVYDPTNYAQAISRYQQLVRLHDAIEQQARRLPSDLRRYRVPELVWTLHDLRDVLTAPILEALNDGDPSGQRYRRSVEPLELLDAALAHVPPQLRARLSAAYGTIQTADSIAMRGVHQAGVTRARSAEVLNAIRALESDTLAGGTDYHTQAALLDKLTGAALVSLRVQESVTQLTAHALEQAIIENKRRRETEAALMNARIHQWRNGADYAEGLVHATAERLDRWRQP